MSLVERMLVAFPFSKRDVDLLIATAPRRYKLHLIEKRNNRGMRVIAQPTAELKIVQRWLLVTYVESLPVHPAAMAYRKNISIKDHARMHVGNKYLLKLDFADFFPSINDADFKNHLAANSGISLDDQIGISRLLFREEINSKRLILSIGAPSSPAVSNTILFPFDTIVGAYCRAVGVCYSRYADDLAFSTATPRLLDGVLSMVRATCQELSYPRLQLNEQKTVFTSTKFRRQLTGLILANDGKVSVGREKKRLIRAMAHRFMFDTLATDEVSKLRGLIAFMSSVDEDFVKSIRNMLGEAHYRRLVNPVGDITAPGQH